MSYDCPNCGKPMPSNKEWHEAAPEQRGPHWCDSFVTAATIRRIVREEVRAALAESDSSDILSVPLSGTGT